MKPTQNSGSVRGRPFPPGVSANPGGKPKKLRAIQEMLDKNHRDVGVMTDVFARLKALAMGEVIRVVDRDGEVEIKLSADPAYMRLYLERVLGPVETI
jgi:hypothetical protein